MPNIYINVYFFVYNYHYILTCIIGDDQQRDTMLCATKRDDRLFGCVFLVVLGHQRGHFQDRLF